MKFLKWVPQKINELNKREMSYLTDKSKEISLIDNNNEYNQEYNQYNEENNIIENYNENDNINYMNINDFNQYYNKQQINNNYIEDKFSKISFVSKEKTREKQNNHILERGNMIQTTINPFIRKSDYLNDLDTEATLLRPKNSNFE